MKGHRLWLDDRRKTPVGYTLEAKTADECIALLEKHGDDIEHVSLDHDLADAAYHVTMDVNVPIDRSALVEKTGYAVLEWMHEHDRWVPDISIHSLNPRGAQDMLNKLENRAPKHVKFRRVKPGEV